MSNIQILPVHLVNKIAAGEVIERPASIVKELVENALDAGATRIEVAVEDGGRRLISVSDNGSGMDSDDLALAFVPHATSKIRSQDDLFAIHTMGFRGEALASIGAVSHAHIRTRRLADEGGHEIEASGETIGPVRPCAAASGTTITIRDLFFNTPARRKFMKTANTELGHITEQMIRLALPHPQVAFSLTHNGRSVQNLPAVTTTGQRVADIFGEDLAPHLITINQRSPRDATVDGLVAKPQAAKASGAWQYFFLNGRFIRDRLLAHALKEAYRGILEPSRWPVGFIFLQVAPDAVDVNVHPTKIEVRFRDGQAVHGELLAALRETLNRANLAPAAQLAQDAPQAPTPAPGDPAAPDQQRRDSLRQAMADFFKSAPSPQPRLGFAEPPPPAWADRPRTDFAPAPSLPILAPLGSPATHQQATQTGPHAATPTGDSSHDTQAPATDPRTSVALPVALPTSAMQIHNSYIVTSDDDGLIIIDQHALHERLIYNDLKRRLTEGSITSQRLLIPQTLTVSPAQSTAAEEHAPLLASLGIEVAPFGPQTLAIQRFPMLLASRGIDPVEFIKEVLDHLCSGDPQAGEKLIEDLLETMACKAAVKAGDPLTAQEMDSLLRQRIDADKGSSCPHGRPTTLRLSLRDLQKQFKRT